MEAGRKQDTPSRRAAALVLAFAAWLMCLAGGAGAQILPIPGIPDSLGGLGPSGGGAQQTAPEAPPGGGAPAPAAPSDGAAASPTQALIDILRDDTAREALIRELENAAGDSAGTGSGTGGQAGSAPAPDAAASAEQSAPAETLGDRTITFTRDTANWVVDSLYTVWLRIQRLPSTVALSGRTLEDGVLVAELERILPLAVSIYGSLLVLRLLAIPIRRRIVPARPDASWLTKIVRRAGASLLDLAALPLAVFFGIFALFALGLVRTDADGQAQLSDSGALFLSAFMAVEGAIVLLRMLLSPGTPKLRIISLPDSAARSLWRVGLIVTYLIGYGQFWAVPVVSGGVSVFVARAAGSVLSTVVVVGLIVYVLAVRRRVADYLTSEERSLSFSDMFDPFARRWHWPVLAYLAYLLITVTTRPGNVLIPLLATTLQAAVVVVVSAIVFGAITAMSSRRMRVPGPLANRLPLLEERVNQLVPQVLRIARLAVLVAAVVILLDIVGFQFGGLLSGDAVEGFASGMFGVFMIAALLSVVWLGMTSWVDYRLNPFVGSVPTPREITLLTLMKNAVTVALIIIGGITSLAQLGMNVGPLIASAGVIGLAISFGAQRMVEDIFSGIFIQAEGAMNVGDVVDVGGTVGTVEKLTVRSVTLRDLSGVVHVIPFSSSAKISNYMRDFSYHVADIGVAYREDVEDVKQAMYDAFEELRRDEEQGPLVIGDLEWFGLNAFGASELVMRARIKTAPGSQWGVGRAYNAIVKRIFDERGIEIPFPHQTVYFGEDKRGKAPPLHMRIERPGKGTPAHATPGPEAAAQSHGESGQTVQGVDMPSSED